MVLAVLLLSVVAAVLPPTLYLLLVRWLGRLEREPLSVILLLIAWGAIGGTTVGLATASFLENILGIFQPQAVMDLVEFALYVPAAEELAKGLALMALVATARVSHTTSGLIYGMAVGLGFAVTENIIYSLHVYQHSGLAGWYSNMVIRTLFSSTVHAICSGLLGFGMAWAKVRLPGHPRTITGIALGLTMAVALHGAWNGAMFIGQVTGELRFSAAAFMATPFLALVMLFATWRSLESEKRIITRELTEEASAGLLPATHIPILADAQRRRDRDWLPASVDRARYVEQASLLALRRRFEAPPEELESLRQRIRGLLAPMRGPQPPQR